MTTYYTIRHRRNSQVFIGSVTRVGIPLLFAEEAHAIELLTIFGKPRGKLFFREDWEIVAVSLTFTPLDKPVVEAEATNKEN